MYRPVREQARSHNGAESSREIAVVRKPCVECTQNPKAMQHLWESACWRIGLISTQFTGWHTAFAQARSHNGAASSREIAVVRKPCVQCTQNPKATQHLWESSRRYAPRCHAANRVHDSSPVVMLIPWKAKSGCPVRGSRSLLC